MGVGGARGFGPIAVLVTVACLLVAGASRAAQTSRPSVVFIGTPSELVTQDRLIGEDGAPKCALLGVRVTDTQSAAALMTNGLGRARIALAPSGHCPAGSDSGWAAQLLLPPTRTAHVVALRPALHHSSAERVGRIVAFDASGEIGSASVVMRRAAALPLWGELKWFVGFIVPAFLTFLLGRHTVARAERRKARSDLIVYRTVKKNDVDAVVRDVRIALDPKLAHPGWQILQTLREHDVILNLPDRDKERLVEFCEHDRMPEAVELLSSLFPLHSKHLKQSLDEYIIARAGR